MPAPKGQGVANDAAEYEDLLDEPKPSAKQALPPGEKQPGIAEDAGLFAELVDETTDKARTLDSDWLYQSGGHVFGPVKPKDLLEKLYAGEIDGTTLISTEDKEFLPLKRYGVFRVHLPKVVKHKQERAEARALDDLATKARLKRRLVFVVTAVMLGAFSAAGVVYYIRNERQSQAEEQKRTKEDALKKELEQLLASVTIEPPLIELVDEADRGAGQSGRTKRKRRGLARFSGGASGTGGGGAGSTAELSQSEIMGGVGRVFGSFKPCIVRQIQSEPDSVPEQIVLTFSIGNDGVPQNVALSDRYLRKTPLNECLSRQLGQVRFRKFTGEVQNVEYPITIGR